MRLEEALLSFIGKGRANPADKEAEAREIHRQRVEHLVKTGGEEENGNAFLRHLAR
jgi:hypothetical protein